MQIETESSICEKGYTALDADAIRQHLVGKIFLGSFPPVFKYIVQLTQDGGLVGKNNYGHYDIGRWLIDSEAHTLSVDWDHGWVNSTNHVYRVDDVFKLFDVKTGKLNTRFDKIITSD